MIDSPSISTQRFLIFRCLWAVAALFHYHWTTEQFANVLRGDVLFGVATSAIAILVLLFPKQIVFFALLLILQVADVVWILPASPNHWLLAAMVSLTILPTVIFGKSVNDEAFEKLRTALMLQVAVFYFFTFFWKLNTDFLNPVTSCGVQFYHGLQGLLPWLPANVATNLAVVYSTLLVELLLPFLLLWRRSRTIAVIVAIAFHFALGLHVEKFFLNFSSVMYALLFLFLPNSHIEKLLHSFRHLKPLVLSRMFALLYFLFIVGAGFSGDKNAIVFLLGRQSLWMLYAIFFVSMLLQITKQTGLHRAEQLRPIRLWGGLMLLLVFLNGTAPIVGLKTGSSWQMYSNIVLDAKNSNHLLIPRSFDLFGKLADHAKIDQSNVAELTAQASYPTIEIRRVLQSNPSANIALTYKGQKLTQEQLDISPFNVALSFTERKLMRFHPLNAPQSCVW